MGGEIELQDVMYWVFSSCGMIPVSNDLLHNIVNGIASCCLQLVKCQQSGWYVIVFWGSSVGVQFFKSLDNIPPHKLAVT